MLTEKDVIDAVLAFLRRKGYSLHGRADPNERGVDLEMISADGKKTFYIEAKGATSSKPATNRYGKQFTGAQVKSHVAGALLKTMGTLAAKAPKLTQVAIAVPDNAHHCNIVDPILPLIRRLGISVFYVNDQKKVRWVH
ncbi:MAG: hypothetical protein K8S54_10430 [Spirochaetia bacterium]|nr:hypothetical protein [Spirochaetia bacterium]